MAEGVGTLQHMVEQLSNERDSANQKLIELGEVQPISKLNSTRRTGKPRFEEERPRIRGSIDEG
jgi:hypothetical protein